jgi:hypothetical protein
VETNSNNPTEIFDARIVQAPLQGLLRNTGAELERRLRKAMDTKQREEERKQSLLLIVLRITRNSYEAISFLCSTAEDAAKRKKEFVFIVPPVNRQIMDLLFSLVYMIDDFPTRSMDYELSAYRDARKECDKYYGRFGADPKWHAYFDSIRDLHKTMEAYLNITPAQKANPELIPYWLAPYKMLKMSTKSHDYLAFLEKWLYDETSSQAHLKAVGLHSFAGFILSDFAEENQKKPLERNIEGYIFRHFSRTLAIVLAIVTEIDVFCSLGNRLKLAETWALLGGYAEEASDIYKERYQGLLA